MKLPEDWKEVRLQELIFFGDAGTSVNSEDRPRQEGELGILKTSAVTYSQFDPLEHKTVLKSEESRLSARPKKDCILVSRMNTPEFVGASVYVECDYKDLYLPDRLWQAECKNNACSMKWLSYLLASSLMRFRISSSATGTSGSMKNISKRNFLKLKVPLPPLPEQRKIAEILGTWDEAIALTERRIEAARQRKKGLMQRLLTGRVRFPEFEGEAWQTVKLGEIFDERKERGYEELPLLSVTAEEGIIYRDELDRRDTSSSDKSNYLRVREGDVTYNTMRMWQGRSGVSEYEGIVSPAYTVCEPKPSIDVVFAGYLFQLPSVIYKFRRYSQGMVSDTWTLRFDNFAAIKVQIPSLEEQKKIAAVLQACDREIDLLEQKRDALQRQKKGLMQRLLTGRVRVEV
jgi:type I restriction enzyme S subunit